MLGVLGALGALGVSAALSGVLAAGGLMLVRCGRSMTGADSGFDTCPSSQSPKDTRSFFASFDCARSYCHSMASTKSGSVRPCLDMLWYRENRVSLSASLSFSSVNCVFSKSTEVKLFRFFSMVCSSSAIRLSAVFARVATFDTLSLIMFSTSVLRMYVFPSCSISFMV